MHKLTKKELESIYYENTNDRACEILGVTKVTLLKYIRLAGIKTKGKGNPTGENARKIEIVG
jgi:hypothetical protein